MLKLEGTMALPGPSPAQRGRPFVEQNLGAATLELTDEQFEALSKLA